MSWHRLSAFVLRHRIAILFALAALAAFMGWQAQRVQLSYELARILPVSDPDYQRYETFKKQYGEDGSVMVLGVETDQMYQLGFFRDWYVLNRNLKAITGIKDVLSNANLFTITRDDSARQLRVGPLLARPPQTQAEVDSLRSALDRLPFYQGFVQDSSQRVHLMGVTFAPAYLNTAERQVMVRQIEAEARAFGARHGVEVHLSGMPYIRTALSAKVSRELILLMGLAFAVTATLLALFFRSWSVVVATLLVVGVGVVCAVGLLALFDYRITLLTGLLPPLIIVIGVPNGIFLLNRYHEELARHPKAEALRIAIEKVGETTFFANVTTSIGFVVFYFTGSPLLLEFGLVAALSIMTTYALSLTAIPIVFSYLPEPSPRQRAHLDGPRLTRFLRWVDHVAHRRRPALYVTVVMLTVLGVVGLLRLNAIGYVVDDLPQNDPIYTNLKFFEKHFKGVMPFEVAIDAGKPGRALTPQTFTKIRQTERLFAKYPEFTRPLSVNEGLKFSYQAFRGGDPKYYVLPPALELQKLAQYAPPMQGKNSRFKGYLDSARRYTRISFQTADVGTVRWNQLISELQPKVDSIFNTDAETGQRVAPAEQYTVALTGSSLTFTRGNDYLLKNLAESTALAIFLVSVVMVLLLRDVRLSLIAILPSLVPLIVTAGIMGYAGIALKPSTILIFSIAFGLSSDGTIYFITKYRDEIRNGKLAIGAAVSKTIRYTGVSMFYTALILFAGFAIFTASTFKGTVALGLLVSITLLMGMASNLILLPAFLLSVEKRRGRRE